MVVQPGSETAAAVATTMMQTQTIQISIPYQPPRITKTFSAATSAYTFIPNNSDSQRNDSALLVILGAIIGALAVIVLLLLSAWIWNRRRPERESVPVVLQSSPNVSLPQIFQEHQLSAPLIVRYLRKPETLVLKRDELPSPEFMVAALALSNSENPNINSLPSQNSIARPTVLQRRRL
ncbi:hypothetical protein HK100_006432 [Physocladia obscura]|uniref:Uncharacterized protein n=1 Tax=Physocladia obscura TaxID=109957 RepID=A0AAD5T722_9FUNG|nr:hypothetical protein HK100_006432 [Physocladia obscura]